MTSTAMMPFNASTTSGWSGAHLLLQSSAPNVCKVQLFPQHMHTLDSVICCAVYPRVVPHGCSRRLQNKLNV